MSATDPYIQQELVGFVLGTLTEDERIIFQVRLQDSPDLQACVAALEQRLRPLAALPVEEPAGDLADRIMARVATTSPLKYVAERNALRPIESGTNPARRPFATLNEWVALAACLALMVGVAFPRLTRDRDIAMQKLCASNLAAWGGAVWQYADANAGQFPRMPGPQPANWRNRPNRNHFTPVLRLRIFIPRNMYCPTTSGPALDAAVLHDIAGFLGRNDLSFYSTQNLNGPVPAVRSPANMPFAADPNPLFDGGTFKAQPQESQNSRVHKGAGQNTLFLDGSVRFLDKPVVGEPSDDIWRAEHVDDYTGVETQTVPTDAFLIP